MTFAKDFKMNVLDHKSNRKVKSFFDLIYQSNLVPSISKRTRVGKTQQRLLITSQRTMY